MQPIKIHIAAECHDLRRDLPRVLRREGFDVSVVDSGYPIVEMMDDWPDLFIIDIELPGINGIEVCKWLKSHESSRYIPVVLVSGEQYLKVLAASAHPDDYLEKPIDPGLALEKIRDLLITAKAVGTSS